MTNTLQKPGDKYRFRSKLEMSDGAKKAQLTKAIQLLSWVFDNAYERVIKKDDIIGGYIDGEVYKLHQESKSASKARHNRVRGYIRTLIEECYLKEIDESTLEITYDGCVVADNLSV